jgi:tRNA modification GTPase
MYQDTIAAIATPLGKGGIGIVRLSGTEASSIAEKLFSGRLQPHHLTYGHIRDSDSNEVVDEVLVSYMPAPHSYTCEDVVEINCHGGPMPLQRVLELALRCGARLANPGEFTLRAFLNGRLDLAQAESVLHVIQARTAASLRLAVAGLEGNLSNRVKETRSQLMPILAYLTACIDFPEDEVEQQDVVGPLSGTLKNIHELLASADAGIIYRQGVRTAIVGRPNVGKSSLLNRLLRHNRAIVSPIPGTTRDTLEEVVNIKGVPFVLVDTAGIRHGGDQLESLSVERSRQALEQSDLVLLVLDTSQPLIEADQGIISSLAQKMVLVVANKNDLPYQADLSGLSWPVVLTSALNGDGLGQLEETMVNLVLGGQVYTSDRLLVSTPRQKQALEKAANYLESALAAVKTGLPEDFISIDLTSAVNALGEITGETVGEELLESIFSQFCVGK